MAVLQKALARTAAATSSTTLYTVPSATTTVLTNIVVDNTSTSAVTFTLSLDGVELLSTAALAASASAFFDLKQVLATTKTITGFASTTAVKFHISGVEIS
jgi:hypothetical protein